MSNCKQSLSSFELQLPLATSQCPGTSGEGNSCLRVSESAVCPSACPSCLPSCYRLWPAFPRTSGRHCIEPLTNADNAVCLRLAGFSFTYNAHSSPFFSSFLVQMALSHPRSTEPEQVILMPPTAAGCSATNAPCELAASC